MTLIGSGGNGQAQPWSVILMPSDHRAAALTATVMLAFGTASAPAAPILRAAS